MGTLKEFLLSLTDLSEPAWNALQPALSPVHLKKGDYLLREGEVCNSLFYIERGYCRSFYLADGEEKNMAFYFENDIATNISSFGSGQSSAYALVACEDLSVVSFDRQQLFAAAQQFPEIETLGKNCIRRFAMRQEEFANLLKLYTAQERLEYLGKHHPHMLQRVSLSQLASFLGVARETLSRARRPKA